MNMVETAPNNRKNTYPQLHKAMQFGLDEIDKIKYYFIAEIDKTMIE